MGQEVAILDIGSSKVTVLIGERSVNNTINIIGRGECEYAGFSDGKWFQPEQLSFVFGHAISNAETNSRTKITQLTIGVPGEFTTTVCRDCDLSLSKKRRITDLDLEQLHNQGNIYAGHAEYDVINIQPIHYILDDDRKHNNPIGQMSSKLGGTISYTLAEKRFISFIDSIMDEIGIDNYDYCSSLLAESLFLFEVPKRDQYAVLVDIGYLTTNVAIVKGDGILNQFSFSMGGGHISGDLANFLEMPFIQAESLKKKVVLSLDPSENDVYEVGTKDQTLQYSAIEVNAIVSERIKTIAKTIEKCFNKCDFPAYIPIHMTGGGLSYLRGARDFLSKQLGRPVEIIAPTYPQFNRPHLSSALGLLDMVLNQQEPSGKRKGFFARLLGK